MEKLRNEVEFLCYKQKKMENFYEKHFTSIICQIVQEK